MRCRKLKAEFSLEVQQQRAQIRERALTFLARREHSVQELRSKLEHRGLAGDQVAGVVAELAAQGLVCDRRFAEAWLHSRVARGHGPLKIHAELSARGVAEHLIEERVAEFDGSWGELARSAWSKKYAGRPPRSYREWVRQARFLQGQGFTSEQIREVLGDPVASR